MLPAPQKINTDMQGTKCSRAILQRADIYLYTRRSESSNKGPLQGVRSGDAHKIRVRVTCGEREVRNRFHVPIESKLFVPILRNAYQTKKSSTTS